MLNECKCFKINCVNIHIDVDDEIDPRGQSWYAHVCGCHVECDHAVQLDIDAFAVQRPFAGYFPGVLIDSEVAAVFPGLDAILDCAVGSVWLIVIPSLNKDQTLLKSTI